MIGVFDSGVGGLSVWLEIVKLLPNEKIIYFGDSAYCPYGHKSQNEITERVDKIAKFLISQGCELITVACNTVTAAAIDFLRTNYRVPFVGMEPAIKPAILNSKTGVVGVLATKATLMGSLYKKNLKRYASDTIVLERAGDDGLVALVESGKINSPEGDTLLRKHIEHMIEQGADHIVLGCTHYPFLIDNIRKIAGDNVTIVNPAPAVAKRTMELLNDIKLQNISASSHTPVCASAAADEENIDNDKYLFYTTGNNNTVIWDLIPQYKERGRVININI